MVKNSQEKIIVDFRSKAIECFPSLALDLTRFMKFFFSVPDAKNNTGDLLVVDHLNHFTASSIEHLLFEAGFADHTLHLDRYRGGLVTVAHNAPNAPPVRPKKAPAQTSMIADLRKWKARLETIASWQDRLNDARYAIYGAGFYGTLISGRMAQTPVCFLDRNPHLIGTELNGIPICQTGRL